MLKVLFLSHWYPNRYDQMAGLFVQKHAEAVCLFADVALLYVHPSINISKQEIEINSEKGFTEIKVYYPYNNNSIFSKVVKQFNYLNAYKIGFKLLHETWGKPDITQVSVFTRTAIIALIYKYLFGTPYVVIEHWSRYFRKKPFKNLIHKLLSNYVARKASAILSVTNHLQKCLEIHGMKNDNYQIINNVVDNIFFEKLAKPNQDKIRIINVTCFDDEPKNLSGILSAIKALTKIRTDFEVYLIGYGTDFDKIKMLSQEMGLYNKTVFFTGMLIGKELVIAFQQSHFSILFSNYENIPVVISESLACGLPIVSTNVGGISEHIDNTNGLLIEAKNEKAFVESLNYMLDHYMDYDQDKLKISAKAKYSYQSVGKQLANIYHLILREQVQ